MREPSLILGTGFHSLVFHSFAQTTTLAEFRRDSYIIYFYVLGTFFVTFLGKYNLDSFNFKLDINRLKYEQLSV